MKIRLMEEDNEIAYRRGWFTESGYYGYSMSNNAVDAYDNGEMPWSKWTKSLLLDAVKEINPDKLELAKKMNVEELRKNVLNRTSWHHTSKYYNKTNFYSPDEYKINRIGYHFDFDLLNDYSDENATYNEITHKWEYDGEPIKYKE